MYLFLLILLPRKRAGICPQHNVLFDTLTVKEHLLFFAALKGMDDSKNAQQEVDRMITSIGLSAKRDAESRNLSGGMKRKLSVGNALIGDSKVLQTNSHSSYVNLETTKQCPFKGCLINEEPDVGSRNLYFLTKSD